MILPPEVSEEQFLNAVNNVIKLLSSKFRFGYHESEDIVQEGTIFAIKAMASGKYNPKRPLENFLYTHIRNRLINFKRDNFVRPDPPCKTCVFFQNQKCSVFEERSECTKFTNWERRNAAKRNIMQPVSDEVLSEQCLQGTDSTKSMELSELEAIIDAHLPTELRSDYLRMRSGVQISLARREKVKRAILNIYELRSYMGEYAPEEGDFLLNQPDKRGESHNES